MKKRELLTFNKTLNELIDSEGTKFAYAATLNLETFKPELKAIRAAGEESADHRKYENERLNLCEHYSKKDTKGNPLVIKGEYIIAQATVFAEKLKSLQEKYYQTIKKRVKQLDDLSTLLDEEVDLKIVKVKLDDLPKGINIRQMSVLVKMVKE